jgi:hypothetical protein
MPKTRDPKNDPRGSNRNRRMRKIRLLADPAFGGDGTIVPCVHCARPLDYDRLTADRIQPGGTYAYFNVQPSCLRCNVLRGDNPNPRPFGREARAC